MARVPSRLGRLGFSTNFFVSFENPAGTGMSSPGSSWQGVSEAWDVGDWALC